MTCFESSLSTPSYEKMRSENAPAQSDHRFFFCVTSVCAVTVIVAAMGIVFALQTNSQQITELQRTIEDNRKETQQIRKHCENALKTESFRNSSLSGSPLNRFKRQSSSTLMGAHLVGRSSPGSSGVQRPSADACFLWRRDDELSISNMAVEVVDDNSNGIDGTFLSILRTGYYFIYAQVTYYGTGRIPTGHEVIRIPRRSDSDDVIVLMQYANMQVIGSRKHGPSNQLRVADSGYQGGMFYLRTGDKIGVRPANRMRNLRFRMEKTKSFFGLFLLND